MRDGVELFHARQYPKDVFSDGRTCPITMERTGYHVALLDDDSSVRGGSIHRSSAPASLESGSP